MQKNSRSPSGIDKFQARLKISRVPPTKAFILWGVLKVEIENFNRDSSFQARLKIQARLKFSRFGPLESKQY